MLEPVAHALSLAHDKGICHRDLKPGNVFVVGEPRGADFTVKLLDFGVATFFSDAWRTLGGRRRVVGANAFTPAYGAPEQFSSAYGVTGPWTDVFALALILVELVAGREPMGDLTTEELSRVATNPLRRPTPAALGVEVPPAAERVLAKALAVYPAERWQTVGTFWAALREALNPTVAEPPAATSSHPSLGVTPAGALLIALALAAAGMSGHDAAHGAARAATAEAHALADFR